MKRWDDLTEKEQTPEAGFREAELRIAEWKTGKLDLGQLKLKRIPTSIGGLKELTTLSLHNNSISDLGHLKELKELTTLSLHNNSISNLGPLKELKQLTQLRLGGNSISDLGPLKELKELTTLLLSFNSISDLGPLKELKELTTLSLYNNSISDLGPLKELKQLTEFWFHNNSISNLGPLKELKQLTDLRLFSNSISDLGPLKELKELTKLSLQNNFISDLGPLKELKQLTKLSLQNNPIASIAPIKHLLEKGLKLSIKTTNYGDGYINLHNSPLQDPPLAIAEQGTDTVLEYWLKQKLGQQPNYSARVLIVGQGRAGKTSLKRKMVDAAVAIPSSEDKDNASTIGIEIVKDYPIPPSKAQPDKEYIANVWDFGGQREQHMPHQYFFGRYSLYVVVVNIAEGLGDLGYWLRLIDLHGKRTDGEKTAVVVVFNEKDTTQPVDASLDTFSDAYPELRLEKVKVNLGRPYLGKGENDPRYEEDVLRVIHREFLKLPRVGKEVPAPTVPLLERINAARAAGRRYLTVQEFGTWCAAEGVEDRGTDRGLIEYFKTLGEVIYFAPHDTEETNDFRDIKDFIIIDVEWAVEAVYYLLGQKDIEKAGGRFDTSRLEETWAKYRAEDVQSYQLLKNLLMEDALEVCFEAPNDKGKYIAACLLPENDPGLPFSRQADGGIRVRLHYPKHIPVGLVTRLVVRLHQCLAEGLFYRNGAVLQDHSGKGAKAKIEVDVKNEHYVNILIDRGGVAGRSFLEAILRQVSEIHQKSFRDIEYERLVPCLCSQCRKAALDDVSYYDLLVLERREAKDPSDDERCNVSDEKIAIHRLLGQVRSPEAARRAEGRMTFEGTPEEFDLVAARHIKTHVTGPNAQVAVSGGDQEVKQEASVSTEEALPFWRYVFERQHIRSTLGWLAGAGAVAIVVDYLPKIGQYAWPVFFVVALYGVFRAMHRRGKYYNFARIAFGTGFGILGILNALPFLEGVVYGNGTDAEGNLIGFFGNFRLDPTVWINIMILIGTLLLTAFLIHKDYKSNPVER
jgi:hypothetical protein